MANFKKFLLIIFCYILFITNLNSKEVPDSFADLVEKLIPSVVNISATRVIETRSQNPFPFQFPPGHPFEDLFKDFDRGGSPQKRKTQSLGSGFIIDKEGIIITNNHVIQSAEGIFVKLTNGKEYEAKVLGTDPTSDIAVIKINTKDSLKAVTFADSDKARVGDWVIAIGNPFGLGGTVTAGIISARNRDISLGKYDDFIQTDAPINQGNSGGPLFNIKGEVVGINSAILSNSGGSVGIGFAIPANFANNVVKQITEFGEIKRGYIGVRIQEVTKEIADSLGLKSQEGALVSSATAGGPADKAGIESGDIILEFNNKKVDNMRKLPKIVADTRVGQSVEVKIWRNKKILTKNITVTRLEEANEYKNENSKQVAPSAITIKELGIKIRNINNQDVEKKPNLKDKKGVYILEISGDSPLALLPVKEGEIIIAVANIPVSNVKNFEDQFKKEIKKNTNSVLLTILDSNNQSKFIGVKIK
ncbi:MAG: DegQ family serine endoprotease [Proteobacteria bacterium]|nr:DegQ family serine endoprotease [Candidatus Fonsibacter sp. PEL4]